MKKKMDNPSVETVLFDTRDIIVTSGESHTETERIGEDERPIIS